MERAVSLPVPRCWAPPPGTPVEWLEEPPGLAGRLSLASGGAADASTADEVGGASEPHPAAGCSAALTLAADAEALASEIDAGVRRWGVVTHGGTGRRIYAMEVDGYGNWFFGDDANVRLARLPSAAASAAAASRWDLTLTAWMRRSPTTAQKTRHA